MVTPIRTLLPLLVGALALSACPCPPTGLPEVFYDDLQRRCGELPCEWRVDAGAARSARTIHQTEWGLRIDGESQVSRPLPDVTLEADDDGVQGVSLLTRCDLDLDSLTASLVVEDNGTTRVLSGGISGIVDTSSVSPQRVLIDMTPEEPLTAGATATELIFETTLSGGCLIDELRVVSGGRRFCM